MQGIIYRIYHEKSGKSYIGKTYKKVNDRFKEHIKAAKRYPNRPLYRALNKYGVGSFGLEILGTYEEGILEEKEIEFIKLYNSYGKSGYNATLGGDGTKYLDLPEEEIIRKYNTQTLRSLGQEYNVDYKTIRALLVANSVVIRENNTDLIARQAWKNNAKKVRLIDIDEIFSSAKECAIFLANSDIADSSISISSIETSITRVCNKGRLSYKGLKFEYVS